MLILGAIGMGLVAGWVAARLALRAPWNVRVWVLLGTIAQGLIVLELALAHAAIAFAAALVFSALACATCVRSLERRYAPSQ